MSNAISLKDILAKTMPQESWKLTLLSEWATIMGNLACRVRIEKIEGSTLILGVQSASWMQELYLLSSVLLKTINTHLGKPYVQKLIFKAAGFKKKEEKKIQRPTAPTAITYEPVPLSFAQKQALAAIQDTGLRDALKEFFYRCAKETKS